MSTTFASKLFCVNCKLGFCNTIAQLLMETLFSDEITASFRRFGHLFVDWPHKAESKSYFPPKGEISMPTTFVFGVCVFGAHSLFELCIVSRICIPAISR